MAEITGLLLAAGQSRRFGSNKLLASYRDRALVLHGAAALSPCDRVIAVVRADDTALRETLSAAGIETVVNPRAERGMGTSIACGVRASSGSSGWCILPGDMPNIPSRVTRRVVGALRNGATLVAPCYRGQRGHPVGFSHSFADALQALDGERGACAILGNNLQILILIDSDEAGIIEDIDTPLELAQSTGGLRAACKRL